MLESLKKNRKGIIAMLASAICVCFGQLLWKMSAEAGVVPMVFGFGFYGLGAFLMIFGYRFGKLSVLQPILSVNYILSIVLGFLVFDEPIRLLKCVGVLVIMVGICLIAGGDETLAETTEDNETSEGDGK